MQQNSAEPNSAAKAASAVKLASSKQASSSVSTSLTGARAADRRSRGVATVALLAALALIFSYIEVLIPFNFGIPGVKLGIANIVVTIALYKLSAKHAASVNVIRVLIAGLLFNGIFGALYSLAGAIVSLLGMIILKKTNLFSVTLSRIQECSCTSQCCFSPGLFRVYW